MRRCGCSVFLLLVCSLEKDVAGVHHVCAYWQSSLSTSDRWHDRHTHVRGRRRNMLLLSLLMIPSRLYAQTKSIERSKCAPGTCELHVLTQIQRLVLIPSLHRVACLSLDIERVLRRSLLIHQHDVSVSHRMHGTYPRALLAPRAADGRDCQHQAVQNHCRSRVSAGRKTLMEESARKPLPVIVTGDAL
jgi:hypothetical protein